jgi:hypothetical protein
MGWFVTNKKVRETILEYPSVTARERLKKVEIRGFSRMSDPDVFYDDLLQTLVDYFHAYRYTLIMDIYFEYINTSSSKWVLNMLSSLDSLATKQGLIEINWYYEEDDETIKETGEIFRSTLNIPVRLIELK